MVKIPANHNEELPALLKPKRGRLNAPRPLGNGDYEIICANGDSLTFTSREAAWSAYNQLKKGV